MKKETKNTIKPRVDKRDLSNKRKKRKNFNVRLFIIVGTVLAVSFLSLRPYFQNKYQKQTKSKTKIEFKKEGQLFFFDKEQNQLITTIDIEIAEDDYERALGLMYRYTMSDSVGMLFIMEEEEPQAFWMKNTYISLDIMYLNRALEIVKIQKYTQPLSEQSIPSVEKSKYVVEVVGGFCDKLGIEEGDSVKYERTTAHKK